MLVATGLSAVALLGCGSKELRLEDDRQISEEQLQESLRQRQMLEQGLRAQQESMQRLRDTQETQGAR